MFWKAAIIFLVTFLLASVKVMAFSFSNKNWTKIHNYAEVAPPYPSTNSVITFVGFDGGVWTDTANATIDSTGLHLKFDRRINPYYVNYVDGNPPHWVGAYAAVHDTLTAWRDYYLTTGHEDERAYNWIDKVRNAMYHKYIWFGVCVKSDSFFRYGKFRWEVGPVSKNLSKHIDPGVWIFDTGTTYYSNLLNACNEIDF